MMGAFLFRNYSIHNRQLKPEHTALPFARRFYADGTAVMFDDFAAQSQADTGTVKAAARL